MYNNFENFKHINIFFSIHEDDILFVNNRDAEGVNTLKNEPEKLLINNNLNYNKRQQNNIDKSANKELSQEYKKLNSEDQEINSKQIISMGQTDIYAEKMKIRIPDPTFDDNYLNEKSNNSVRGNSIQHKQKEEVTLDHNGQANYEDNKEPEEEFKNHSNFERQVFIDVDGNNEEKNLIDMEENFDNEKIMTNNNDLELQNNADNEEPSLEEKKSENANGEEAIAEKEGEDIENGEIHQEGQENENVNEENGNMGNEEEKEIAENTNGEIENDQGIAKEESVANAEAVEKNVEEVNAENAENNEGDQENGEHVEIQQPEEEANAEAVENNPEMGAQPENPPQENAEVPQE